MAACLVATPLPAVPASLSALPAAAAAQAAAATQAASEAPPALSDTAFELTVASIMRGPELVGVAPENVRWTDDGEWIYFRWKPGGRPWYEEPQLYRVRADGGEPERLTDTQADSLGALVAEGDVSPDERVRVVSHLGDLFLIDRSTLRLERLTRTRADETDPVFGPRGEAGYFIREDDVFRLTLADASVRQLTDFRRGPKPEDKEEEEEEQEEGDDAIESQEEFLEEQQEELFERIRVEQRLEEEREEREEAREAIWPERVYLREGERVRDIAVGGSGEYALVVVGTEPEDSRPTVVPDYVTESGYTDTIRARAKVGDDRGRARAGLVDLATGDAEWLDVVPTGAAERAEPGAEAARDTVRAEDGESLPPALIEFLGWNESGTHGLLAVVAYDFKDQWLYVLDADSGELRRIAHDHDEAWIGGPCDPWIDEECAGWLPAGDAVWFISERSGWSHLYRVPVEDGDPRQLTEGDWEVSAARIAPDEEHFLFQSSEPSRLEEHVWRMELDGGGKVQITTTTGRQDAVPSPSGERLAIVHSDANSPPDLYVAPNRPGAEMRRLTVSPTEAWASYEWIEPEVVWVPARDGARVPARIYRPQDVGATPNGAAVIFVHGAGYLQNAHRWWSHYYREYMFHHLLASRGYTVLDMDYRGSAGHGRDWRTAIYRHMGGKDLDDQVDGARWLVEAEGVDPERIGIYGGSYGGFITLMALFTEPETFAAGAALRSVTDWAHYNHWYTSRILNLPQGDTFAYQRSSPIYFAEGLEDPLVMLHGMVDTNVHFQDVVRLSQRLIELGKTDWELAVYPAEGHAFEAPSSWTDEYRRILEIFEENLRRGDAGGGAAPERTTAPD